MALWLSKLSGGKESSNTVSVSCSENGFNIVLLFYYYCNVTVLFSLEQYRTLEMERCRLKLDKLEEHDKEKLYICVRLNREHRNGIYM